VTAAAPGDGSPRSGTGRRVRRHIVWACVALAYLLVFPYFARLENPNENVRVWMTRAIVAHGTFALDEVEREWGAVSDRAAYGGRHFSGKAPGTSLLGVPVLLVATRLAALAGAGPPSLRATTWLLRVFSVALPLAIFLLYFGRHVERETGSPAARDLLVVGLGLGTMLYPYGLVFVGHAQSAALLFSAYLCATRARDAGRPPAVLVAGGALAGLAVVFEYQALLATAALAVFVVWRHRRRALWFFLGALGPAVLLGGYHTALFGRPWDTPLAHADDPVFLLYHQQRWTPRPGVLWKALFASDNGLFVYSPFLAAGLVAAVARPGGGGRADGVLVVAVTAVMLLFLAGLANWRGGWCAGGPRYIAAVVPFLTFGLALSWRRLWQPRPLARAALAGAVVAAVVLCVLAGAHFPHYPLQLDNPVFDLTLPFIGQGYVPYGLGWALGLRGPAAYLPLAIVVSVAVGVALRRVLAGGHRVAGPVMAAGVAVCLLGGLALVGRRPHPDEQHALELVRSVWEPPRRGDGTF
jgi:hypothetical protein